jgi:predicted nucleic acid-binding protein
LSPFSIARSDTIVGRRAYRGDRSSAFCLRTVLAETLYLLARHPKAQDIVFDLLQNGALSIAFQVEGHVGALRKLLQKYRDVPMSLADACIVRMAEIHEHHAVVTLDSDFSMYRKHGRVPLTLICPVA